MLNTHSTRSQVFCCNSCGAPVALEQINPDDLAYVCQSRACGRTVHVDCPEGLRVAPGTNAVTRAFHAGADAVLDTIERKLAQRRAAQLQQAA